MVQDYAELFFFCGDILGEAKTIFPLKKLLKFFKVSFKNLEQARRWANMANFSRKKVRKDEIAAAEQDNHLAAIDGQN